MYYISITGLKQPSAQEQIVQGARRSGPSGGEPPSQGVVALLGLLKIDPKSDSFSGPFSADFGTQNDPQMAPESTPGASQDALPAKFLMDAVPGAFFR